MTKTYTGKDATVYIAGNNWTTYGLGDFSLNLSRDTVDHDLICEEGNYTTAGALSVDGSFTAIKLAHSEAGALVQALIEGTTVEISGSVGDESLKFHFKSAMITGFDLSIGDNATITEGSFDFTLKYPYNINDVTKTATGGTLIKDY